MSLLLEALKKAEKAKEEAQRRAASEQRGPAHELQLENDPPAPASDKPVLTRDRLPDISQVEIRSEEVSPKARKAPERAPAAKQAEPQATERAAAKKVFEAKFKEPNPRLPFYITMGVLLAFALGTVGYFWYQLRPPPSLVNANPASSGAIAQPAAAPGSPPAGTAPSAAAQAPSIPGLPNGAAVQAPPPAVTAPAAAPRQPEQAPAAIRPAPAAARETQQPRAAAQRTGELAISRPLPRVHPKVESGYSAYLAGNYSSARTEYQEALRDDAANRDALLGLAALDVKSGSFESGEAIYLRLLQADPRDAHAQAGLIALRSGRMDPLASESRVKSLLAADPNAHVLNFTLGNQLAQQGRWAEAQQQYFKAFAAEPENADFAYNLAVSLDHLRQSKLALEYYRRALSLAGARR
jgi:tetratricopeptide (TPR) repeat protein